VQEAGREAAGLTLTAGLWPESGVLMLLDSDLRVR